MTVVHAGFAINDSALLAWLKAEAPAFRHARKISVRQFSGGQSNPTYCVEVDEARLVLRKKPPGPLLTGAHAIEREFRVMSALNACGFPVPGMVAMCTDPSILGTPFYLMACVEGRIFWDPRLPEVAVEQRFAYYDAMNLTISQLHKVDLAKAELLDYGRSGGFFARQLARWGAQYQQDVAAGRIDAMDRLLDWLQSHIPPDDETALVHGDFRLDNLVFHGTEPRVIAVLDWELSTLGHPLADFGYHLMTYRLPDLILPGLRDVDLPALGLPSEDEYVDSYCRRTGRDGIENRDYYLAFNLFRAAAIFHGIRGRVLRGNATSARALEVASRVEQVASIGWQHARRARGLR